LKCWEGAAEKRRFPHYLGVDEAEGSLTLAGDIDPDGYLKLMHSSTEKSDPWRGNRREIGA